MFVANGRDVTISDRIYFISFIKKEEKINFS